jgi:hypothetical protein
MTLPVAISGGLVGSLLFSFPSVQAQQAPPPGQPSVIIRSAPSLRFTGDTDSNSPAVWDFVNGVRTFHLFTSHSGAASRATGTAATRLGPATPVSWVERPPHGAWMEAVLEDDQDVWYGYYHNELPSDLCPETDKMVPRIGSARSFDQGRTWEDLGVVLEVPDFTQSCDTNNYYFVGGVGDFTVVLDADGRYLYLFYSQYVSRRWGQGVAVARMVWADRDAPAGRMMVWQRGAWIPARSMRRETDDTDAPRVTWWYPIATPLYPTSESWHDDDTEVDAFWGPSVHWNTYLQQYVMLLNRAVDTLWTQEGIYASYAPRLDDPGAWTTPTRILAGGSWYPQVIGEPADGGTDKQAGQNARLYMLGRSDHAIQFVRP